MSVRIVCPPQAVSDCLMAVIAAVKVLEGEFSKDYVSWERHNRVTQGVVRRTTGT